MEQPHRNIPMTAIIAACISAAVLAVYWRSLGNGYVFDDRPYLLDNPHVQAGITWVSIKWAFTSMLCANWHPITWLSTMLDCQLFALKPWGHHLTNLVIHIANTVLLLLLLRRVTGSLWRSAFVAALFALHPLHVESVAWVAERKDVLSTFFAFTAIWAYVRYAEKPSFLRYSLVFLSLALGLMAKPMLVTLPIILLLMDYWPLRRFPTPRKQGTKPQALSTKNQAPSTMRLIVEKLPLFALSAGSSLMTYIAQRQSGAVMDFARYPLDTRVFNALVSYLRYILKMLWPSKLAAFYPYYPIPIWQAIGAGLFLIAVSIMVFKARKSRPYLAWGWLWYIITLVPVIGIVQVGDQSIADRYTYIPLIGPFVMIAWAIPERWGEGVMGRWGEKLIVPLAMLSLGVLMVCTFLQVGYWKSDITLFGHAAAVTKNNAVAHNDLGLCLAGEGKLKESVAHLSKALEINPRYADAHVNMANTLILMGRKDDAMEHYYKALDLRPGHAKALLGMANLQAEKGNVDNAIATYYEILKSHPNDHEALYNLGLAFHVKGDLVDAISNYRKALEINPRFARAQRNMGFALAQHGKTNQAVGYLKAAIEIDPEFAEPHLDLGRIMLAQGKSDAAISHFKEAIRIKPDYAEAHSNLGVALETKGKLEDAIDEYRIAINIKPDLVEAHNNLAYDLLVQGRYAESWSEVHTCEQYGLKPDPSMIRALSEKMPDPGP
ncbi:MAG TPA: tetratricopeptide repeat protein [Armatimonadota bacterium]|nr:tetratricopeptide repeat protein [Armatimonadota bacterium]